MAKKKSDEVEQRRGLLDKRKKETMLAVVLRNPEVYEQVRDVLKVRDVRRIDDAYAVVYQAARLFFEEYGELPEKQQLLDGVQQLVADHPAELSEGDVDTAANFIDLVFDAEVWGKKDLARSATFSALALATVRQFKEELLAAKVAGEVFSGNRVPADLAAKLREAVAEADEAATMVSRPVPLIFPEGWRGRPRPALTRLGVGPLDEFTGGGLAKREVLLFMGPYGSCKTLCAVQGMIEEARRCQKLTADAAANPAGRHYKAVLASYEMTPDELIERCLAYLARIPHRRLVELKNFEDDVRHGGDLLPYEERIFKAQLRAGNPVPSEAQRIAAAEELLNKHALFLDMTFSDPDRSSLGAGGVRELAAVLRGEQRRHKGLAFGTVWVDHAAAMVANMQGVLEIKVDDGATRQLLKRIPKQLKDWVGRAFDTQIVLLHQLSGEANSRGATAVFHHTDSDECKAIGMYPAFCVTTGTVDKSMGRQLCVWRCSKHRRQPPKKERIVRIVGQFNQVKDVSNRYAVETGRIVSIEEQATVGPAQPAGPKGDKKGKKGSKKKSLHSLFEDDIHGA